MKKFFLGLTVILAVISMITTYQGFRGMLRLSSEPLSHDVIPLLVAVASCLVAIGLWTALFNRYPYADDKVKGKLRWVAVGGCVLVFCMSTLFSVMGVGGDSAVVAHLDKTVGLAEQDLNNLMAATEAEGNLSTSSELLSKQFSELAVLETKGAYSSYTGVGEVVNSLTALSQTFTNIGDQVRRSIENRRKNIERAREVLRELRNIIDDPKIGASVKIERFRPKLAEFNQLMRMIQEATISPLVKAAASSLEELTVTRKPSGVSTIQESQRQALGRLDATTKAAQNLIKKFADKTIVEVEIRTLSTLDALVAIFVYWFRIIGAWAISLALDFAPVLFLVILAYTEKDAEERERKKRVETVEKITGAPKS